jgi:predicted nucleic acid-binding protein
MSSPELFFDSSALFAGVVSASGTSRALLLLAEAGLVSITVSEQVIAETERAVTRKVPRALPNYREALRAIGLRIVGNPSAKEIQAHKTIISHQADVPIVVAAMRVKADYLVTLNRRHFVDDPSVAARSGLLIGAPADALAWVRERLRQT